MPQEKYHWVKFNEADWKRFIKAAKALGINPVEFVRTASNERANVVLENQKRRNIKRRATASLQAIA